LLTYFYRNSSSKYIFVVDMKREFFFPDNSKYEELRQTWYKQLLQRCCKIIIVYVHFTNINNFCL